MTLMPEPWDYLIVTVANDAQALACADQLCVRRELGLLADVRETLVLADPQGLRIGSGGSTLFCLMAVLNREQRLTGDDLRSARQWREVLARRRVLIVHAGGDSKRLPAYGPCGKIFVPVPGEGDSALGVTLFDRQLPTYLALPPTPPGLGQVVITAGDVLLSFDPALVQLDTVGVTGLGCLASPNQASRHGVYCAEPDGRVRRFLQKPLPSVQVDQGAVDRYGQSVLDIGVMSLDGETSAAMLAAFDVRPDRDGALTWSGQACEAISNHGVDFYREVCCAMGSGATLADYVASVKASGSTWDEAWLARTFERLAEIPFSVRVLPQCGFLHFGTTRQLLTSGAKLLQIDQGVSQVRTCLSINNDLDGDGRIAGKDAWVEGCRLRSELALAGENVVVGIDVDQPLSLPARACIDVARGHTEQGEPVWFVRCYGVEDSFKDTVDDGATMCDMPIVEWLDAVGLSVQDVWDPAIPPDRRTLWDARLFPSVRDHADHARWLWMFEPDRASDDQKAAYRACERYSPAMIASLADPSDFHARRICLRGDEIRRSLRRLYRLGSGFSAADLAHVLGSVEASDRAGVVARLLAEAHWHEGGGGAAVADTAFVFPRIIHTLGSAILRLTQDEDVDLATVVPGLGEAAGPAEGTWLGQIGLGVGPGTNAAQWAKRARAAAFQHMGRTIVASGAARCEPPTSALRADEIVWGRAPARLDLGGGWSDTPPYSLEQGGCVINAAVDLNGQPPIHCYARIIKEPVIRIGSIDLGTHVEIAALEELLDLRSATNEFALAKAALALSGFSPEAARWPEGATLEAMLDRFGGGIELTTLAAIPKGSGLGTSSIVGAVILGVVQRVMGRQLDRRELFHGVLRLEQALTTGGGWQDQVGGVVDGVKVIAADAGLVPDVRVHYVPADVLDPEVNGGRTLLYYTGVTRLAKDILAQVVGRYLDRDREAMATLRRIHHLPPRVADAMAQKDLPAFGSLIDAAWRLNKQLDPDSSNEAIEALLGRARPHICGAKLLGAGGGGFLLMICPSVEDAVAVRDVLQRDPPNGRARFFDFGISKQGLVVTVC